MILPARLRIVLWAGEEPLITPSIKSIQPGNESLPENTPKPDNFQIQGRTHGQF